MITVSILTVSDSAVKGARADVSGPAIRKRCEELGWSVVTTKTVADEQAVIAAKLLEWSEAADSALILTTGGTGIAARDVTPEATRAIIDREIPGLGELMRSKGLEQTSFAPLSRAVVGTRRNCLIVNLPGSPKGALFSFGVLEPLIPHIVDLLRGVTEHDNADQVRH
ncbi:MAG: MogA/MoaB family molybdenum cofactor biosynthesis protein [Acidobacteriota bacterium]|nr:MogA/MoaB family molybdenum cofactor biosynthesis protein [Acidobacteriota bacterium]